MNILQNIKSESTKATHKDGKTVALIIQNADKINALPMTQKQIADAIGVAPSIVSIALATANELDINMNDIERLFRVRELVTLINEVQYFEEVEHLQTHLQDMAYDLTTVLHEHLVFTDEDCSNAQGK